MVISLVCNWSIRHSCLTVDVGGRLLGERAQAAQICTSGPMSDIPRGKFIGKKIDRSPSCASCAGHLPPAHRPKPTWRYVADRLDDAARGAGCD